jgi:hypothetical protein
MPNKTIMAKTMMAYADNNSELKVMHYSVTQAVCMAHFLQTGYLCKKNKGL